MANNNPEWVIENVHVYLNRPQPYINASIAGPDNATLSIRVDLDEDYESLTVGEIKEMVFAKARELYPSN